MGKTRAKAKTTQAGVTLDAGALIALERGDRRMIALLRELATSNGRCRIPAGVIGQTWRASPRQAILARFLSTREVDIKVLDDGLARACGELCAAAGTSDVIEASVVIVAREHRDTIVTSDVEDLRHLDSTVVLERI